MGIDEKINLEKFYLALKEETEIGAIVRMSMGFASRCWDEKEVFESDLAIAASNHAVNRIKEVLKETIDRIES
jgi:hypothetical protein